MVLSRINITIDKIALWLFFISILLDGPAIEVFSICSLIFLFARYKSNVNKSTRRNIIALLFVVFVFVLLQCYCLNLNIPQIMRLYGITKTILAYPLVILCLSGYAKKNNILLEIYPIILIINISMIIFLLTGNNIFNIIGGSRNYIGSIDVIMLLYILNFYPKKQWLQKVILLCMIFLVVLISGSRTTLVIAAFSIFCSFILEEKLDKKIAYVLFGMFFLVICSLMLLKFGVSENMNRSMSVLHNISDKSRTDLIESSINQFNKYNSLEKLIGNGNNLVLWREAPPHNFFYEILLCYGIVGVSMFLVVLIIVFVYYLFSKIKTKKYIILILMLDLLICAVQPFMTTGFLFQVIVAINLISLYNVGENRV